MPRSIASLAVLLCAWAPAQAGEPGSVDELRKQNKRLSERVNRLEKAALEESIETYLQRSAPDASAEGADSILPGGLKLRVSGQVRAREEVQDRLYTPADPQGTRSFEFAHMRTRLRFDIDVTENLGVVIELQDVRNFGGAGSTTAVTGGVDVKRATIEFRHVGHRPITIQVGRFVMAYGDHRVIGDLEWFDQGRTYDGFRVRYRNEEGDWWIDLFGIRVRETVVPDDDQWMIGFYGGKGPVEGYVLLFGDDMARAGEVRSDDTTFLMVGARVHGEHGGWDYTAEAAGQTGDVNGDDLTAFGAVVAVGFTFPNTRWSPRVGIEVVWASGDENPGDGETEQFQTLFPTNHMHYGYADLVGWSNILDIRFRFSVHPAQKVTVAIDFHHFQRPHDTGAWINAGGAAIRPGAAGTSNTLGDEIDLTVVWKPNRSLSFLVGYSLFLPGAFVDQTGNNPLAQFFYLQTLIKF